VRPRREARAKPVRRARYSRLPELHPHPEVQDVEPSERREIRRIVFRDAAAYVAGPIGDRRVGPAPGGRDGACESAADQRLEDQLAFGALRAELRTQQVIARDVAARSVNARLSRRVETSLGLVDARILDEVILA